MLSQLEKKIREGAAVDAGRFHPAFKALEKRVPARDAREKETHLTAPTEPIVAQMTSFLNIALGVVSEV